MLQFGRSNSHLARDDDRRPYVVSATSMGAVSIVVPEMTGIRQVNGYSQDLVRFRRIDMLWYDFECVLKALSWGLLPGIGIWALMAVYTKPQYGFGLCTVKLASLGRRGAARLIDL